MRPLRVAVVADVLLNEMSGVARAVLGVAGGLKQLGPSRVEVTVVARHRPASVDGLSFERSFAPRVPVLPNSLFALQRPYALQGFDVVHYMDSRPPLDFALGHGPIVAVTEHGFAPILFERDYARTQRFVNRTVLGLLRLADLVVTPSETERRELLDRVYLSAERVVSVHHGVEQDVFYPPADEERCRAEVRSRFGLEGRYVLCVANHQSKKNVPRLVKAFWRVSEEVPDVVLALAGWHNRRFDVVRSLVESLPDRSRVRVLGHIGDHGLRDLYGAASAFVLPSLHESFGLPALEAMACGTPVVAANAYSLPEICGDAAEYVDPYDIRSIAAGLVRVLTDPARSEQLSRLGLGRAATFTWQAAAERHLEAYQAAMERG